MSDFKDKARTIIEKCSSYDVYRDGNGTVTNMKRILNDEALEALDTLFKDEVRRIIGDDDVKDLPLHNEFNLLRSKQRAGLEEDTK